MGLPVDILGRDIDPRGCLSRDDEVVSTSL